MSEQCIYKSEAYCLRCGIGMWGGAKRCPFQEFDMVGYDPTLSLSITTTGTGALLMDNNVEASRHHGDFPRSVHFTPAISVDNAEALDLERKKREYYRVNAPWFLRALQQQAERNQTNTPPTPR